MQENSRRERERLAREGDILDAAEAVFGRVGVEGASMDEIAKLAQFTRKTLYQHFGSKEELLSAVIIRGFNSMLTSFREEAATGENGFEKLRSMGRAYHRFFREHTAFFSLVNYAGRIKTAGKETQKTEFMRLDEGIFRAVAGAIEAGRADGSIRGDVDPVKAAFSIVFTVTGFFCEFAVTGKSFTDHLSLDGDAFVQYTLDLLMESLRA